MFIPGTSSRVTLTPGIVVGGTSTTPFTVEGWFYSTLTPGTNSGPVLLSTDTGSGTPAYYKALTINVSSTTQIIVDSNGAAQQAFNFEENMLVDTWYYVAVSRDSSGYIQVWLGKDGDANATVSTTDRLDTSGNAAWELTGLSNTIGAFVPANRYTTGYISNLRVDSTSLYATTAATIRVPTEPFEKLAGTVFLQNDDTLKDQTGTPQTLAPVGTAAGDALNPFVEVNNSPAITSLGDGATVVSDSPFASGGSSYAFSGGTAVINYAASADWAVGTGDFTIEWFSKQSSLTEYQRIFSLGDYPSIKIGVSIESGTFYYWANNSFRYSSSGASSVDVWIHWAVVRSAGFTKIYKNGVLLGSQITDNNDITANNITLTIGNTLTPASNAVVKGNITNFRWVKGTAVYTGNFTVPTGNLLMAPSANPYGGLNTAAIPAGHTKLLIIP
jgi:hypothetical protein